MGRTIVKCMALLLALMMACCFCAACSSVEASPKDPTDEEGGYRAAAFADGQFWAAGTGGRLDRIQADKQVESIKTPVQDNLLTIWADENMVLVGGENGVLLYSKDSANFSQTETGISGNIFSITRFNGSYYACSEKGKLIHSTDGVEWASIQLDTRNDIISIAANEQYLMAVTRQSDIAISEDGNNWQIDNFNDTYADYYDPYIFAGIRNLGKSFFVYGQAEDGMDSPFTMFSESGSVWIFKPLSEINGQEPGEYFPLTINAVGNNLDQILAACNNGRLLTITECSTCHQMTDLGGQDLFDMAFGDGKLLVVGNGFAFDILEESEFRQYNISPEQAYEDFQAGNAVIIDVRSDEEYQTGHITGSLHIPVEVVAKRLEAEVPDKDTQLIFYCEAGGRATTALETALELGYAYVYNLGGIGDWPYETETGAAP